MENHAEVQCKAVLVCEARREVKVQGSPVPDRTQKERL